MMQAMSRITDCFTMVRVPINEHVYFKWALDAGATGIVVPMVNSKEESEQAVMVNSKLFVLLHQETTLLSSPVANSCTPSFWRLYLTAITAASLMPLSPASNMIAAHQPD